MAPSTQIHRIMRRKKPRLVLKSPPPRAFSPPAAAARRRGREWSRVPETVSLGRRMRLRLLRGDPARQSPRRPCNPSLGRPERPEATSRRSSPHRRRSPPVEPGSSGPSTRFPVPWPLASFRTRKPRQIGSSRHQTRAPSVAPTIGSAPIVSPPIESTANSLRSSSSTPAPIKCRTLGRKGQLSAVDVVVRNATARERERSQFERIPLQELDQSLPLVTDTASIPRSRSLQKCRKFSAFPSAKRALRLDASADRPHPTKDCVRPERAARGAAIARRTNSLQEAFVARLSRSPGTVLRVKTRPRNSRCFPRKSTTPRRTKAIVHASAAPKNRPARDPVGPFLHYLMAECGVSPHTLAAYRSDLMRFIRWRKSKAPVELANLDAIALGDYVDSLHRASLSPSSICRHLASLSTFFRFLVLEGQVSDNVAKLLIAPAVWDRLPTVLSPAAAERLLESPSLLTRLGRRDRAILETLYATGCRASEVVGLRPMDLDLYQGNGQMRRQGRQGTICPARLARDRGISVYLAKDRPALIARSPETDDGVRRQIRPAAVAHRPLADRQATRSVDRPERRRQPAHPEAQLCHPPAGPGRRPPCRPGNARPRVDRNHADLHPGRAQPSPRGSCPFSSP